MPVKKSDAEDSGAKPRGKSAGRRRSGKKGEEPEAAPEPEEKQAEGAAAAEAPEGEKAEEKKLAPPVPRFSYPPPAGNPYASRVTSGSPEEARPRPQQASVPRRLSVHRIAGSRRRQRYLRRTGRAAPCRSAVRSRQGVVLYDSLREADHRSGMRV